MSTYRLYGLKRCSTCVKAMRWLEAHNIAFEFTDYRDQPIDPSVLEQWSSRLGGADKLVNRASTTWRNLPAESKAPATEAEWLTLIAQHPTLIKRPVVVDGAGDIRLGFSESKFADLLE